MLKYVHVSPYRSGSSIATTPVLGSQTEEASFSLAAPQHNHQLSSASSSCTSSSVCTYCSSSVDESSCSAGEGRSHGVDNVSLNSSYSSSVASLGPLGSRASSSVSLLPSPTKTMVRVWVKCLLQELEYKTLCITNATTCRQLVNLLLSKFKMKHRDPNLFYLTMEVTVKKTGISVQTNLTLDNDARPVELQSCHPHGDSRLTLKMRPGGLIRVYDAALVAGVSNLTLDDARPAELQCCHPHGDSRLTLKMQPGDLVREYDAALVAGSQYKSLLVSDKTTSDELIQLILLCNNIKDNMKNYSLLVVHHTDGTEHKLNHNDHPLVMMGKWTLAVHARLIIRKNIPHSKAHITQISTLRKLNNNDLSRGSKVSKLEGFNNSATNLSKISSGNDTCVPTTSSPLQSRTNGTFTTITISSNGASKVTIKSPFLSKASKIKSLQNFQHMNKIFFDQCEENKNVLRQSHENNHSTNNFSKPSWSLNNVDLMETPVDDEDETNTLSNSKARKSHSYNDYENYFYI